MTISHFSHRVVHGLRHGGLPWLVRTVGLKLVPPRLIMKQAVISAVTERCGLEIGGPSSVFAAKGLLPIYPVVGRIDNVNFSTRTAWEAGLQDGGKFQFDPRRAPGTQWIREAADLNGIADGGYDFVLSSHCLEHLANPLRALREWRRVVKPKGHLVLILPDPQRTFDHRRAITTLEHLRKDFADGTAENDLSHVEEVLAKHDLHRDWRAGSPENFRQRALRNPENRCLHHHVFDLALIEAILAETHWRVVATQRLRPLHLIAFAEKR
ncbi:MAG: methyltransferase domain-containing protein [Opitutaceae bacterium]